MLGLWGTNHKDFQIRDGLICCLLRLIYKPCISFIVLHLQGLTKDNLLDSFRHRSDSFLKLGPRNKHGDLLQVKCSLVSIKFVVSSLQVIHLILVSLVVFLLSQVETRQRHGIPEILRLSSCQLNIFLLHLKVGFHQRIPLFFESMNFIFAQFQ